MRPEELAAVKELLDNLPADFQVMEKGISQAVLTEYYDYGEQVTADNRTAILDNQEQWADLNIQALKCLLVALAAEGNVKSFRQIETILSEKGDAIGDFGAVTRMYARMKLESKLTDTPAGVILSGLGGKGDMLRYYFVLASEEVITDARARFVEGELQEICQNHAAELEEVEHTPQYILVKILVSVAEAIGELIELVTDACPFLEQEFICTNVKKPSPEFIQRWMNNELDTE
ncbi:MAG: hypothetical protein AAF738_07100 [Bacteroidota bacterium]